MCHAETRIRERLADAGFTPREADHLWHVVSALARRHPEGSAAVRLVRLPHRVNAAWGTRSNGDTLWAIYRNGCPTTVMLRRSTQPSTCAAFDVDAVYTLDPHALELVA